MQGAMEHKVKKLLLVRDCGGSGERWSCRTPSWASLVSMNVQHRIWF